PSIFRLLGLMMQPTTVATGPPVRKDMTCLFSKLSLNCNMMTLSIAYSLMVGSRICIRIDKMKLLVETNSSNETERLAEQLGKKLRGGEVIELISDLGGGKTTFTRGLAKGVGSSDRVASPT